ncbi:MAG: carbohydrate kinase family protein [Nanoarchaeota archaeon]|nr:MAG: carbohydrate kinase family protein [Nanoarchaeota archaeon]
MFDIITVGSATVDAFAYTEKSDLISIRTEKEQKDFIAYPSGTKILIKNLVFNTGGGGTNTAVACSRLGLKVGYVGCLGNDDNSQIILKELKKEKITFLGQKCSEKTDYSIILDSIEHDRTILNYKGSSTKLRFDKIKNLRQTKWIYSSSLVGNAFHTIEKISEFAARNKIKFAFNPSSYLAERGAKYLNKILKNTTVLVMNKEEAKDITGRDKIEDMLSALRKIGPKYAIITDGKRGVYADCDGKRMKVEPHKVKVVEATGAGDAFASTFVAALIHGKDERTALQWGVANAESVLRGKGAKVGLLTMPKLKHHLGTYPFRISKIGK